MYFKRKNKASIIILSKKYAGCTYALIESIRPKLNCSLLPSADDTLTAPPSISQRLVTSIIWPDLLTLTTVFSRENSVKISMARCNLNQNFCLNKLP